MHRTLHCTLLAILACTQMGHANAQGVSFPRATSGCAMAHCDSRMSDLANMVGPSTAELVAIDADAPGSIGGLGCASNTRIVACTRSVDGMSAPALVVYDADGRQLWNDGGRLGWTAWMSAPIVGSDGSVIAADSRWILRADAERGTIVWQSPKPDEGAPISPVLLGSDDSMVLLATLMPIGVGNAELSVWDLATGALLSHQPIVDPVSGKRYVTRNTPAVSGSRAYVVAEATDNPRDGRLYAIDVCEQAACGGRGTLKVRWYFAFRGPSGASPLVIGRHVYVDGRPTVRSGQFMAVIDGGDAPRLAWRRRFDSPVVTSAAEDPRGGIWVFPVMAGTLVRLDAGTGEVVQQINVGPALGLDPGYGPGSVMSISRTESEAVILTVGIRAIGHPLWPSYVAAIDVSTTAGGAATWLYQVATSASANASAGQYPIVVNERGARRIVFVGTNASTFFVGEP